MHAGAHPKNKLPFAAEKDSKLFFEEVIRLLIRESDKRRQKYVPIENLQIFYHGLGWNFQRKEKEGFKPQAGELEKVSTNFGLELDRIAANDLTLIADFVNDTSDKMEQQLFEKLRETMISVTEETGNTVSVREEGSLAKAFLKMIQTTEASVARDGTISRPTFFPSDASFTEKLRLELINRPDFQKEIELARRDQEERALAQEAERLARYDNVQ